MEGKEKILLNIIDFVSNNDIKINMTVNEDIYTGNEYSPMNNLSPSTLWVNVSKNLNIDEVSSQLLKNFKDAIDNEDYTSALYMKKEISNRLILDDNKLKEVGVKLLSELKNGCYKSKSFNYLTSDVNRLLNDFENGDSIMDGLDELSTEMEVSNSESIQEEIKDSIFSFGYDHPLLSIEEVVLFFKLIE